MGSEGEGDKRGRTPPGTFYCRKCGTYRPLADRSDAAPGLCATCYSRMKSEGIKIYKGKVRVTCPNEDCGSQRWIAVDYYLSSSYGPDRTCGSCQRKKNAEAKLAATVERKKLKIGDVVGRRNGVPEVVECQILKSDIRRCEACGDNENCLQYIRYVDKTAVWGV